MNTDSFEVSAALFLNRAGSYNPDLTRFRGYHSQRKSSPATDSDKGTLNVVRGVLSFLEYLRSSDGFGELRCQNHSNDHGVTSTFLRDGFGFRAEVRYEAGENGRGRLYRATITTLIKGETGLEVVETVKSRGLEDSDLENRVALHVIPELKVEKSQPAYARTG